MWSCLPPNKHNDAERNPSVYTSDMPTFTTDVRMEKVAELFASGHGHGDPSQAKGSGGGGPVEAVWWNQGEKQQWRIKGTGWVVHGGDIEGAGEEGNGGGKESSGVRTVKSVIGGSMRVREGEEERVGDWSWEREVRGHFGNCSPGMRGELIAACLCVVVDQC
jgi:pyridoxamine 5'-phosphate oxidase